MSLLCTILEPSLRIRSIPKEALSRGRLARELLQLVLYPELIPRWAGQLVGPVSVTRAPAPSRPKALLCAHRDAA